MDWTSFLAGILVGGIFLGFVAFVLGIAIGALQGEKTDQVKDLVKDLNVGEGIFLSKSREDDDGSLLAEVDSMFDEKRRTN